MIDVVSGIIENERGEVLLAQRPPGKKLAGQWEFPGGKLEAGESPREALVRELKEELHLEFRFGRELGIYPYTYEWGAIRLYVFVVTALNRPQPSADVQVFRWTPATDIDFETLAAADREPLVEYLQQRHPGPRNK